MVEEIPFASLLPHGPCLAEDDGVVLLATASRKGGLALGCAWQVQPVNLEVLSETHCTEIARQHETLLRSLPVGASLQVCMTILPSATAPSWEHLRASRPSSPIIHAQRAAIAIGLPHQSGSLHGRLRHIQTLVTLRLPIPDIEPSLVTRLRVLFALPSHVALPLTKVFTTSFHDTLETLAGCRLGIVDTLQAAGHAVRALSGQDIGVTLAQALDPLASAPPVIEPAIPLASQSCTHALSTVPGGYVRDETCSPLQAQVLTLHRVALQTYPGILSAPRAPGETRPLALWEAWDGPLTVVVNVAAGHQARELARLQLKSMLAKIQGKFSVKNAELAKQLDALLAGFFVRGGHLYWGRVHVVLWGEPSRIHRGVQEVIRAGRALQMEFAAEPILGSTLFLQTLPLGFDPVWPPEQALQRARRIPAVNLTHLLPLYGAFRGTSTASLLYLNQRGETIAYDPFDNRANAHMLLTGMPGGGKSFALAQFAQQVLPLGASMVILDRLPSYQDLCAAWHGRYYQLDFHDPPCCNPFYGALDDGHLTFLTALLAELASGEVERLNTESVNVLADALAYFAQTWDRRRGEARIGLFMDEVLTDGCFAPHDEDDRRLGREIARKLRMFYGRGPWARFFDGTNQFALHETLTVMELSGISDAPQLQAGILFVIMHLVAEFFNDPKRMGQRKFFASDETWALLRHRLIADALENISRTYRKLGTSAIFLSQYASDFDSPAGRVIRNGSPAMFFLQQEPEEQAALCKLFNLSPAEQVLVSQARRHDGWSSAYLRLSGQTGGLIRLVPDAATLWLLTQSDRGRTMRREALDRAHGDMSQALAHFVKETYGETTDSLGARM